MNFPARLLQAIALLPAIIQGVEALFGGKSGESKKRAALAFVASSINMEGSIDNKKIIDPEKFQQGLSKVIEGVVDCLNASEWAQSIH